MKSQTPQYGAFSECRRCVFLRTYRKADLWYCPSGLPGGILIVRNSPEPDDYLSVPVQLYDVIAQMPELRAAVREAGRRGLGC